VLQFNQVHSPLLILDFGLDVVDGVRGLHLQGDGFTREATKRLDDEGPTK